MYLTRMYLNPRRRQTGRFLHDPQVMHAAVESAFPPRNTNENRRGRTLWRLDADASENKLKLLILSTHEPSLEHIQEQAGWQTEQTWESRTYEQLLTRLTKGQRYGFRLTANPVNTKTDESGKKRLAHVSTPYQLLWLAKKAEQIGVRFLDEQGVAAPIPTPAPPKDPAEVVPPEGFSAVRVTSREKLSFKRGQQRVTIARATFEGACEVANVDLLHHALTGGVGRAKAYGCGLLTLAPLGLGLEVSKSLLSE